MPEKLDLLANDSRASLAITGWMMGLNAYRGEKRLEDQHEALAYVLPACVVIHITSVIAVSIRHRENLPKAMLTAKKRAPWFLSAPSLIDRKAKAVPVK